jgi:glycosyltransferase involved in cell wall biosynthesis
VRQAVLIVGNFLSNAGGSRGICEDLAERLASRKWRVLTTSRRRPKIFRLADMLLTCFKSRHEYSLAQVDLFSGPAFVWAEAVCWTLGRLGKPLILTLHGGGLPEFANKWPRRVSRLLASATMVTAPSGYLKERMATHRPDIIVIPNAIELSRYPFRERNPAYPNLIWLRAFHEIYNPLMAVKVLSVLVPKYPGLRLTMVGPDKGDGSFQRSKAQAVALGLAQHISFRGMVAKSDVPKALSEADIFLNTTNIDNTPVSVVEGMACGLAVVTTRVGGTPFLITHEHDGLLVSPGDADGMATAVARLLEDRDLAGRCSRNGREKVKAWDWPCVLGEWDKLMRSVLNTVMVN